MRTLQPIAGGVAEGPSTADTLRSFLALTIAVVGATEQLFQSIGARHPQHWESLERSATTFMDQYVVKVLAAGDPELERAVTKHRRRKLAARAGALHLVEPDRNKRTRWAAITLPMDATIPIAVQAVKDWPTSPLRLRSACTGISAPSARPTRSCSPARSLVCCARPSACSPCSLRTRSPRSASRSPP